MRSSNIDVRKNDASNGLRIYDLFAVLIISFFLVALVYSLSVSFFENKSSLRIFRFGASMVFIGCPIVWVRLKYGLDWSSLGFLKNESPLLKLLVIGLFVAALYTIVLRFSPIWQKSIFQDYSIKNNLFNLFLLPLSIDGFLLIVLGPLSEEVMFRGFIYSILRKKYGFAIASIIQAILFGLMHVEYFEGNIMSQLVIRMVPGIIFVLLVEKYGSIYPAIFCHAFINYFLILLSMSL